jgi:hypothetical protein
MKKLIELTVCDGCQSCIEETSPGIYKVTGDHVLSQDDVTEAMRAKLTKAYDASNRNLKSLRDIEDQLIEVANYVGAKCGDDLPSGSGDTLAKAIIRNMQAKINKQAEELAALRDRVCVWAEYENNFVPYIQYYQPGCQSRYFNGQPEGDYCTFCGGRVVNDRRI